ncbi:M14 family zinc carboxypeptidase [Jiangella alkaliphila]|uniref:Zinc carboxypeptidase n=1 Tax=Jiangella alkaliphila TaxID=419479 RepID=A0A1H2JA85_9ACTN|nr:M14 family zinc carboxypeptidase [Jiangella alkaliphila]SDU53091.1 Zinc carboxypeptidase [Jiangella alkaliphila]
MTIPTSHLVDEALRVQPQADAFPTVDELAAALERTHAAHPDVTRVRRVGTSRLGEPIEAITIGSADRHAVVFGGVHPNEPIGNITALHLIERLTSDRELLDRMGYTWHVVPCIDPDGMRLNEGWFRGPLTRAAYGRRFYRPAPDEQVEWTFPFEYKRGYFDRMLPETVALMRLIDDTKPAFMCSLHNGEYGGVYYYLSRPEPELYPLLHDIAAGVGLPLDTGEPEAPYVERYAPAIFGMIRTEDQYDFVEAAGLDPTERQAGDSSAAYAAKYGTLTLVTEMPYWTHPDADDDTLLTRTYADVLREQAEGLRDIHVRLDRILAAARPDLTAQSPFLRSSEAFVPMLAKAALQSDHRAGHPDSQRPATVSERFGCLDMVHMFRLRWGGTLLRALDGELAIGNGTPVIREQRAAMDALYETWAAEATEVTPAQAIPYGKLAAVQYAAIIVTAAHAARRG